MFSKWHKSDLHIHTDKSKVTKENDYKGDFSVDVLVEKLKENKIEMISLTDHNIINCEAYEQLSQYHEIKALVGVEFDIAISEINLKEYVLAIDSGGSDKIEIKPFHIVTVFKSDDYIRLKALLNEMYNTISKEEFDGKINLNEKKKLRTTSFKYLIETFHEEDFFIIAHGNKNKGIVRPHVVTDSIEEAQYNILMGEISALEMKSSIKMKSTIDRYNEGFQKLLKVGFQKDPASYVAFSDNHNCSNYGPAKASTWFKGHLDYETLRICFSDPESRIHTSDKPPTYTPQYIEQIKVVHKNNKEYNLHLSPYLNVFIGGRSSGKSLLFNTLLSMNTTIPIEEKDVFKENYAHLINSETTAVKTNIGNFENSISLQTEAYCQEKIIELFKDDRDLKLKLDDFFLDFDDEEIDSLELEIKQLFNELKRSYREYYFAQNKILKGDRANLIKESVQTSNKIFGIDLNILTVDYDVEYHDDIVTKLNEAKTKIKEVKNIKFKNVDLFDDEECDKLNEISDLIQEKSEIVKNSKQRTEFVLNFFKKIKDINDSYIKHELDQEVQRIESAKDTLDADFGDYRNYFMSKLALKKACNGIEKIHIKLDDKENNQGKYKFLTKLMLEMDKQIIAKKLFEEYFLNYINSKSIYHNLIDVADPEKTDNRIKQFTGVTGKSPDKIDDKINTFLSNNEATKTHEIIENGASPISTASTSQGRKASIFLDIKLDSFAGHNKTAILMIDQIEDNIDNKYISERLVDSIRNLKKDMQIILVTHNPSIAVYGDAENIIICENTENGFEYRQGGLENKRIREEACEILDGGDIAFKNRMDKYNIGKFNSLVNGDAA